MDDDRLRQLRRLRDAHQRHLDELEVQKATLGRHAPAHIALQIAEETHAIELLDAELVTLRTPDDVQEMTGTDAQYKVLTSRIKQQDDRQSDAIRWTQAQIKELRTEMTRQIAQLHADVLAGIEKVQAENAAQSKQIGTLRTQQQYTTARVDSQGDKLDTLIEERVNEKDERTRGQRRYLIVALLVLILFAAVAAGVVTLFNRVGLL